MLKRLKKNYFLFISTFLILYFFFNLLSGERGLISYFEKKDILNDLNKQESLLMSQIKDLDFKIINIPIQKIPPPTIYRYKYGNQIRLKSNILCFLLFYQNRVLN